MLDVKCGKGIHANDATRATRTRGPQQHACHYVPVTQQQVPTSNLSVGKMDAKKHLI